MRMMVAAAVVLSGALAGNVAFAQASNSQTQACYTQARQQVLQGEALVSFMADCTSGHGQVAPTRVSTSPTQHCADQARLLSGEDKVRAMQACQ